MARAVQERLPGASVLAMAAAVADYRPETASPAKIKKTAARVNLELVRTPDILTAVGASKGSCFVVGFAAETNGVVENARQKRAAKNVDLMVANDVSRQGSGFDADVNAAVLIDGEGELEVPLVSKRELAERIWDRVAELRSRDENTTKTQRAQREEKTLGRKT
jgi:phosphopantothenoylcysteine decarboxylase/phosphopantothenate--cysteine ligase